MKRLMATLACLAMLSAAACGGDKSGEAGRDAAGSAANRAGAKDPGRLEDYRRALRFNPDNEEAQRQSVELSPLVEGEASPGEFGEPAPLPITPNVIGDEPSPSPTPQKQ